MTKNRPLVLLLLLGMIFSQTACYNNYFISKNELQKLESSAEQKDVVTVYGDCPEGTVPTEAETTTAYRSLRGPLYAEAETPTDSGTDAAPAPAPAPESTDSSETPSEEVAKSTEVEEVVEAPGESEAVVESETVTESEPESEPVVSAKAAPDNGVPQGCTAVDVSTASPLVIVTKEGEDLRVTPFNFIMSGKQIVSPEYDLLENLDDVEGAEVSEFSTWKTVALISGIAAAAVGTFLGIGLATPNTTFTSK